MQRKILVQSKIQPWETLYEQQTVITQHLFAHLCLVEETMKMKLTRHASLLNVKILVTARLNT